MATLVRCRQTWKKDFCLSPSNAMVSTAAALCSCTLQESSANAPCLTSSCSSVKLVPPHAFHCPLISAPLRPPSHTHTFCSCACTFSPPSKAVGSRQRQSVVVKGSR
eukprot:311007-Pleurochrysis_carterae.AAC.1